MAHLTRIFTLYKKFRDRLSTDKSITDLPSPGKTPGIGRVIVEGEIAPATSL